MRQTNKIEILDENLAKKIAAGEVVERPSSIVKELIENSIDAGATNITIEIRDAGKSYISISDNGTGILPQDMKLAFIRHATSKIKNLDDLYNINQMGFRGEALYSISAVSKVTLISKPPESENGSVIVVEGGEIIKSTDFGCPNGTSIIVVDLFYNTPARLKFMKSNAAETSHITQIIQKYILSYPHISFKYINNKKIVYNSNGDGSLKSSVLTIYGRNIAENIIEFNLKGSNDSIIKIEGCLGNKNCMSKMKKYQTIFVNSRYIKDAAIAYSIENLYEGIRMINQHPFFIININVNPIYVDVNVHPQKLIVKFSNLDVVLKEVTRLLRPIMLDMNKQHIDYFQNQNIQSMTKTDDKNKKDDLMQPDIEKLQKVKEEIAEIEKEKIQIIQSNTENKSEIVTPEKKESIDLQMLLHNYNYKARIKLEKKKKHDNMLKQSNDAVDMPAQNIEIPYDFSDYKIIGSVFNTYIIIEKGESIFIIDQHAAHERLVYERYLNNQKNKEIFKQLLLIPQAIELPYDEVLIISENINIFEEVGFTLDILDNTISITEVPIILGQPQLKGFFSELLAEIIAENYKTSMIKDRLISISCKKAVKAGDVLSKEEMKKLLELIILEDSVLTCPHGRPFVMEMRRLEIEKRFGRIQG